MRASPRLLLLISALLLGAGVLAGALPMSSVEPAGLSFVDCGAAVFGRPSPLPHPSCDGAYFPLVQVTWVLMSASMLVALAAGARVMSRRSADLPRIRTFSD